MARIRPIPERAGGLEVPGRLKKHGQPTKGWSFLKTASAWFNRDHFGAAVKNAKDLRREGSRLIMFKMAEEPIALHRAAVSGRDTAREYSENPPAAPVTRFDRGELNRILTVYGRMVAAGEWRDYALDFLEEVAVFSIFRRASEMPLFRVEKRPKLRGRQGQYCVIAAGGLVMKRGHELAQVLKVFDKKLLQALAD